MGAEIFIGAALFIATVVGIFILSGRKNPTEVTPEEFQKLEPGVNVPSQPLAQPQEIIRPTVPQKSSLAQKPTAAIEKMLFAIKKQITFISTEQERMGAELNKLKQANAAPEILRKETKIAEKKEIKKEEVKKEEPIPETPAEQLRTLERKKKKNAAPSPSPGERDYAEETVEKLKKIAKKEEGEAPSTETDLLSL